MPTSLAPLAARRALPRRAALLIAALAAVVAGCHEKTSSTAPIVIPVATVTLAPPTAILEVHGTLQLAETVKDSAGVVLLGRVITWVSSDTTKLTVSTTGLVTAVAPGEATITATCESKTATSVINVPPPVGSVLVSPDTVYMVAGGAVQLVAAVKDSAGGVMTSRTVNWQSSATTIATVSATGLVTGVALGTASISAIAGTKSGVAVINIVTTPPPSVPGVTVTPSTATITAGSTLQLTATDALGNRLVGGAVVWTSSNGATATVSVGGVVSALKAGTVTVTAKAGGASGSATITVTPPPPPVAFASVSAGDRYSCGVSVAGVVYCWGANDADQLGTGTAVDAFAPQPLASVGTFQSVVTGWSHACAIGAGGSAWCWGDNASGAIGDSTTTHRATPAMVSGGESYASLAAGYAQTCGVTTGALAGQTFCWGSNALGQAGQALDRGYPAPMLVGAMPRAQALVAGFAHTCGLATTGAAYCWGDNSMGQLGTGTTTNSAAPVPVAGSLVFTTISSTNGHSCALTSNGAAYCWGDNSRGQLGTGDQLSRTTPTAVAGGLAFTRISAGGWFTCGVATDGKSYCWGDNVFGELGAGDVGESSLTPVPVVGGLTITSLSAGWYHACAMTPGGAYCWGDNTRGQLGVSSDVNVSQVPVRVSRQP